MATTAGLNLRLGTLYRGRDIVDGLGYGKEGWSILSTRVEWRNGLVPSRGAGLYGRDLGIDKAFQEGGVSWKDGWSSLGSMTRGRYFMGKIVKKG